MHIKGLRLQQQAYLKLHDIPASRPALKAHTWLYQAVKNPHTKPERKDIIDPDEDHTT